MTSIDPASALSAQLRAQLGSLSPLRGIAKSDPALAGRAGPAANRKSQQGPRSADAAPLQAGREDLAASIARRVAAIDRQVPDRRRQAFRVFLESLLLEEWGDHLMNDPGFQRLVGEVQEQMEADPRLLSLMEEAAERLLGSVGD